MDASLLCPGVAVFLGSEKFEIERSRTFWPLKNSSQGGVSGRVVGAATLTASAACTLVGKN